VTDAQTYAEPATGHVACPTSSTTALIKRETSKTKSSGAGPCVGAKTLHGNNTMNDEQIRTAIAVLKAFAASELSLNDGILEDLENAISDAYNQGMVEHYDSDSPDDDPGFDPMFLM
jgi:hypothetical protein